MANTGHGLLTADGESICVAWIDYAEIPPAEPPENFTIHFHPLGEAVATAITRASNAGALQFYATTADGTPWRVILDGIRIQHEPQAGDTSVPIEPTDNWKFRRVLTQPLHLILVLEGENVQTELASDPKLVNPNTEDRKFTVKVTEPHDPIETTAHAHDARLIRDDHEEIGVHITPEEFRDLPVGKTLTFTYRGKEIVRFLNALL
jgi:hypothetical protein